MSQEQNQEDQGSTDNTAPQSGSSPSTQSNQGFGAQPIQDRPAQTESTEPEQATDSQKMSADQIISILKQEPMILTCIKEQIARRTGVAPTAISDNSLFLRMRQSEPVRVLATTELTARGYSVDRTVGTQTREGELPQRIPRQGSQATGQQNQPYESPDSPQVQRRVSPYTNLPSLSDLNAQFPATRPRLKRFGSDAFGIRSGNTNDLPMDLPAGPDYVLGPGDSLTSNIWGSRPGRLIRTIDRQGQVDLPETGTVMVAGMTVAQACLDQ